ncbi:MAG: hypothetical protein HFG93_02790, partial [Dorea sp.]|nr:hypothetical protein [Dorea sp.]
PRVMLVFWFVCALILAAARLALREQGARGLDIGIYHEEWGIGFRLEDNCLITENGCENLSADIPRTIEDIEAVMNK